MHQHIGLAQQGLEGGQRTGLFEVQRQAFLGAVGPDKVRGQAFDPAVVGAGEVTRAGALHFDDARAQVSELASTKRRRNGMFQGNNGNAVKGSNHARSPSSGGRGRGVLAEA